MKDLVYISHPCGGLVENTKSIEKIISELYKDNGIYENFCIVSPVHNFGFMYETTEYSRGLDYCLNLLEHCEYMLVFGDYINSTGCTTEIQFCKEHNIPYFICSGSHDAKHILRHIVIK